MSTTIDLRRRVPAVGLADSPTVAEIERGRAQLREYFRARGETWPEDQVALCERLAAAYLGEERGR